MRDELVSLLEKADVRDGACVNEAMRPDPREGSYKCGVCAPDVVKAEI